MNKKWWMERVRVYYINYFPLFHFFFFFPFLSIMFLSRFNLFIYSSLASIQSIENLGIGGCFFHILISIKYRSITTNPDRGKRLFTFFPSTSPSPLVLYIYYIYIHNSFVLFNLLQILFSIHVLVVLLVSKLYLRSLSPSPHLIRSPFIDLKPSGWVMVRVATWNKCRWKCLFYCVPVDIKNSVRYKRDCGQDYGWPLQSTWSYLVYALYLNWRRRHDIFSPKRSFNPAIFFYLG